MKILVCRFRWIRARRSYATTCIKSRGWTVDESFRRFADRATLLASTYRVSRRQPDAYVANRWLTGRRLSSFQCSEFFGRLLFLKCPSGRLKKETERKSEDSERREGGGGGIGASSYKRAQVAWSYRVERGGGGSESLTHERIVRTAGKWVPTSGLAPLVPLVGSSSFAENSIIMIAYDVNDARRQQLFLPERVHGAAGPGTIVLKSRTRPRDIKECAIGMANRLIYSNIRAGATKSSPTRALIRFHFDS